MNGPGLQKSIWAHGNGKLSVRTAALVTGIALPAASGITNGGPTAFAAILRPRRATTQRVIDTRPHVAPATGGLDGGQGLSVSIWAPKNAGKRQNTAGSRKVWTRTVPQPVSTGTSSLPHEPTPKVSDLGLPYQVQHYILVMIEWMLEESCYEFASRWIPEILCAKGWDCAEAVELSTWKCLLPTALPPNATRPLSNNTLEKALADAVRIRNSAVHRHLCNNDEMRKMALQAQDLMSMFCDQTRQDKFYRLWSELKEWEVASTVNASAARARLEAALHEISERPVDDMDWTPNAKSLEEVSFRVESDPEDYEEADAMELD
ncbi:uncharacterized protein L3040_005877 [Drepanopeziza brunnea f. sp. 'multigermtubi']|uniref:uncharacterized protein n=1 Tax=Drepanopeziza brunnea f. sp. 'multigermtubi' TaxID=698441 RepID=UPI0023A630F5|nr:hypothetical protein L3040_005877 [Drepanopeziza brunnea f. sp. 'multigermtubi']